MRLAGPDRDGSGSLLAAILAHVGVGSAQFLDVLWKRCIRAEAGRDVDEAEQHDRDSARNSARSCDAAPNMSWDQKRVL
jgi:hypothetical protein